MSTSIRYKNLKLLIATTSSDIEHDVREFPCSSTSVINSWSYDLMCYKRETGIRAESYTPRILIYLDGMVEEHIADIEDRSFV